MKEWEEITIYLDNNVHLKWAKRTLMKHWKLRFFLLLILKTPIAKTKQMWKNENDENVESYKKQSYEE